MKDNFHVQIVKSILSNLTIKSTNMLYVKYYNAFEIPINDIENMLDKGCGIRLLYHQFDSLNMQDAYGPFLKWIKDLYYELFVDKMSIDELLNECDVYMVQRIVIQSYIETGKCIRDEEPLANEVEFEENQFINSIINILIYISNEIPLFIVLDKLHLSCSSVVKLLSRLTERENTYNIGIEASFNELYHIQSYMQYEWWELMRIIQIKNISYDVESSEEEEGQELKRNFIFNPTKTQKYLLAINNMIFTLAFQQALYYLNIFYDKIVFEKIVVDDDTKYKVFAMLALADINTNNPEHASLMCESINNLIKDNGNLYQEFSYNYLQIMTQVYFKQKDNAEKYVDECMRIAGIMNDKKLILKTRLAYHWAIGVWCDMLFSFSNYREPSDQFIEELMENGYINSVIYMCGICKEQNPEDVKLIDEGVKPLVYFNKALKIANDIGNTNVIGQIYNKKHVFAHSINCHNFLNQIVKEKAKYININNNDIAYAQASAYMSSQREEYEDAHINNNNALCITYNSMLKERYEHNINHKTKKTDVVLGASYLKKNNMQNIEDTLHNMAINCISAGDYHKACDYLLTMIRIMESENRLRFTNGNIAKLYGMIAMCYYYMKVYYNCYLYMDKAERHMSHLINPIDEEPSFAFWDDCMFFYRFVKALLHRLEDNPDMAEKEFEKAAIHMEPLYSSYFYIYPIITIERAKNLTKLGKREEAVRFLEICHDYCIRENLLDKVGMLEASMKGKEYEQKKYNFELDNVTLSQLVDAARYEGFETQFCENQNDNVFVSSWQDIINNNTDTEVLMHNGMEVLEKIYVLDGTLFIKMHDDRSDIVYNDTGFEITKENEAKIVNIFEQHQTSFITNRTDKSYKSFKNIAGIFGINNVVTLIGIPVIRDAKIDSIFVAYLGMKENFRGHYSLMKEERLATIQLAINQLVDAERRLVTKKELEISLRREEQANEAKSTFLANMSHEIRTPMNTVMGMSEIVLREELSDSVRYNVEGILSASNNLLSIINDILDFSKIESGKMDIVEVEYKLSELLIGVSNMIKQRIADKPIQLVIDVDENIPDKFIGDEVRVRQILINLLNNAVKFTDSGVIALKLKMRRNGEKATFLASVSDTGMGIKKEDLEKLFDSFQRVDMQKNRTLEGTGLGLSICKTLLELMEGRISVESEYGVGSTFYFELPQKISDDSMTYRMVCENQRKSRSRIHQKNSKISMPDASILVVDDNDMNLRVAQGLLQPYSMKMTLVKGGKECIEAVKRNKYNLIMLDHMMPELDGIETLNILKQIKDFDTPVIALTANAISGVRDMYIEKGFTDYLPKPIDCIKLEEIIKKYLPDNMIVYSESKKEEPAKSKFEYLFDSIDTEIGLHYSGGRLETYRDVLKVYLNTGTDIIERLQNSYTVDNWKNYNIDIHSLKSSSMSIGAEKLSELCRKLEAASKNLDIVYIKQNHAIAIDSYINVLEEIERYFDKTRKTSDKNKSISTEELKKKLEELLEYVEQFIMINAEKLINELIEYNYFEFNPKEDLLQVKEMIDIYDTDAAEQKIKDIIKCA